MAFCEQCGNKISDTAKFCGKCGTPVSSGQTEARAEIPQASAPAVDTKSLAQKAFNAGMACLEADQYNEAIAHFTEAIRHKPDSSGAYYQRGYAHSLLEQYDAAIADLTAALPNANDKASFYFARGYNYYKSRQYGSAIADLDQAIRLNPNEAKYYGTRGSAYLENGDADSAYADCERGLQIDPNEETLIDLAHAIDEADEQDGMSAPASCAQCGAPLEEGEMFCANCGAKVGAVPQYQPAAKKTAAKKPAAKKMPAAAYQPAPVQTQGQAGGESQIKRGFLKDKITVYFDGHIITVTFSVIDGWKELLVDGRLINMFWDETSNAQSAKYTFQSGEATIGLYVKGTMTKNLYQICINGAYIGGDKF